jgi:hypothetical protein
MDFKIVCYDAEYIRLRQDIAHWRGGGYFEYGNELPGFVKESHFLDQLSHCQLLKTNRVQESKSRNLKVK